MKTFNYKTIPLLERQNIAGYSYWQSVAEKAKTNKYFDEIAIKAYKKFKQNAIALGY